MADSFPQAMDLASNVISTANVLVMRADNSTGNGTSTSTSSGTADKPPIYKVIGLVLAILSGLFIGVSFVLKKMGLLKANKKYNEEAGEGYGYLKNAYWWTGMTLMIIGEICNFVAYAFVDAILVTPLGALSVVVTTILSAIFLKERLSFVGKVGCFNCIVGSVVIVINAPVQSSAGTIQEMQHYVLSPGFLSYAGVIIVGCLFVAFWVAPRYGKKSMLVYLTICSLIGGLSVVATQGLGAAIVTQAAGTPQFNQWFLYVLLVFVIATLLTEIIFLNKALNLFNAALVTPTYYVYFTSSTIVASAILFQGFKGSAASIATVVLGFLQICSGVVLLQLSKSAKDVPDSAVFKGDLDQVRTIADQEEPESEPRADTIRGGASIVRAMSKIRTERQAHEAERIQEERMMPIGENETVEWDGLRRRKTVLGDGPGSLSRRKTVHPPLGMSHFPDDDNISNPDSEVHPGFFGRIGRKAHHNSRHSQRTGRSPVPMEGINVAPNKRDPAEDSVSDISQEHVLGLPAGLQRPHDDTDTSYKGAGGSHHIRFTDDTEARERADSQASSHLAPPRPPPHAHGNKRQFSFQNVFHKRRSDPEDDDRPTSKGGHSFSSRKSNNSQPTEEERLGLVTGDSSKSLPQYSELPEYEEEPEEDWDRMATDQSSSPEQIDIGSGDLGKQRTRDDYDDDDLYDAPVRIPKGFEDGRGGASGGSFV